MSFLCGANNGEADIRIYFCRKKER